MEQLDQLLSLYWLRPEQAIWRALDIQAMRDFRFEGRSLDFGCGDGLFSFVRSGGGFARAFDAFQSMQKLEQFFEKTDVYDAYDESYAPLVSKPAQYNISVGFDHKANLLQKASTLGLYLETVEGDGNGPLPFDDNSFQAIFSNIVYWLDRPAEVFAELGRILSPGGRICIMLPNITLPQYSFYNALYAASDDPKWEWLQLLDRGRLTDNIRQAKSDEDWRTLFRGAGLSVAHHSQHLSKPIIQAWDIGFRPMFPALMKMVESVEPSKLPAVKEEWVKTLKMFAEPFCRIETPNHVSNAFHCYILTK
ncbi:class I SAM-dependent methyltransferase [Rhizobium ruizarguesonis]